MLDAKKCVDSLWYIAENIEQLKYLNLRQKISERRTVFYIDCCVVVDEFVSTKKGRKKELCINDEIIDRIYYERDKNSAHKDDQYKEKEYSSILDIKKEMEEQIVRVREVAAICLPNNLTLDFVCYDRELFRLIHRITADVEEQILKKKYPQRDVVQSIMQSSENIKTLKILNDTEELRSIEPESRSEYGVVFSNGLCFYEGVQEMQDACVRSNVLFNENIWISVNNKEMEKLESLTRLGAYDEFGIIQEPPRDPILLARIQKILNSPVEKD